MQIHHKLTAGKVHLGLNRRGGRILSLDYADGGNLLWVGNAEAIAARRQVGDWHNTGGDKLWASQQAQWSFSHGRGGMPHVDPAYDDTEWEILPRAENHAILRSPLVASLGARLTREILLREDGFTLTNTITREQANPFPVHCWNVTQVLLPDDFLLGLADDPFPPAPPYWIMCAHPRDGLPREEFRALPPAERKKYLRDAREKTFAQLSQQLTLLNENKTLQFTPRDLPQAAKFGAFGSAISAVYPRFALTQSVKFDGAGCYPDGANLEVFYGDVHQEGPYCEMEILSPNVHLAVGENLTQTIDWQFHAVE